MTIPSLRLNPEYLQKARDALASARSNLIAAKAAADAGAIDPAISDLITAGEEVARALLYYPAYEDVLTFDPERAGQRIYLFSETRLLEHDPKQATLASFAVVLVLFLSLPRVKDMTDAEKDAIDDENVGEWLRTEWPGLITLVEMSSRLEELRQSRYSGPPKTGPRGRPLSRAEFDHLAAGVEELIELSAYQIETAHRPPGELERIQQLLPAQVRRLNPQIGRLRDEAAAARKAKKGR